MSKKLLYVAVVIAMLAMMIPGLAVSVSAANGLTMTLVDPITGSSTTPEATPAGYNVTGSQVKVTAALDNGITITGWSINNIATAPGSGPATFVSNPDNSTTAYVQGVWGDAIIAAHLSDNTTITIEKKWGQIASTTLATSPAGYSPVTWNEAAKAWFGTATVSDTVMGTFYEKDNPAVSHLAEGVILNWFLVPGNVAVSTAPGETADLIGAINPASGVLGLGTPSHVSFAQGSKVTTMRTVTDMNGYSSLPLYATGEEAVQVVVIPEYPFSGGVNINVTPEVTSYDFYTTEMEVVPQVRWAGEKIVLEKNFGDTYNGQWVKFSLQNQSVGSLEGISGLGINDFNAGTVWTPVVNGFASCILVSSDEGVANVTAALYASFDEQTLVPGQMINQHFFTTYFLKFESLTLGDVQGKRIGHNTGLWTLPSDVQPTNPWDPTGSYNGTVNPPIPDNATQTLNVSQDALLRANVKGWFTSSNPTTRGVSSVPGTNLLLPAGRWVLPDDWAALAGPNWKQSRMHWDIMCNPDGSVTSVSPLGVYYKGTPPVAVSGYPIIGPFSPGLELMTPTGWSLVNQQYDPTYRNMQTVVPDGNLNAWDAPMPSAKIIFQILSAGTTPNSNIAGYFKSAMKSDIYYVNVPGGVAYTNPFYQAMIPAHEFIPVFINNGGYDWDSFDLSYGPYTFWNMINQHAYMPQVATTDPSGHPTVAEVYSDNHGEAMIWLNGDWNLNLDYTKGAVDIAFGTQVGTTTVQATADYPYARVHQAIQSNTDVKTWLWGGQVLGTDAHIYNDLISRGGASTRMVLSAGNYDNNAPYKVGSYPFESSRSLDKVVWVWATDRDGLKYGVQDATVTWTLAPTAVSQSNIRDVSGAISQYNEVTKAINLTHGFLSGTNGVITDGSVRQHAVSTMRSPLPAEELLFNKFWGNGYTDPVSHVFYPPTSSIHGLDPKNFVVAAIDIQDLNGDYSSVVTVNADITTMDFSVVGGNGGNNVLFTTTVNFGAADPLDDAIRVGDANCDGVVNMGDVTAAERMILGYNTLTTNAVLNTDGTVDMGTVVKIERIILGLN